MADAGTLSALTSTVQPVTLDEVLTTASLQVRVDRKYVVPLDALATVLDRLDDQLRVLQIEDRRVFSYESVYFDTPELLSYHQHAHGRRRRVKVRTRAYLDSSTCLLEFKRVGSRGETIKTRYPYPLAGRYALDGDARALAREELGPCVDAPTLRPSLVTAYHRTTLVDMARGSRVTCDVDLRFEGSTGGTYGPLPDIAVLESKSVGGTSPADEALRRMGVRPVSLSKYCVGLAVLDRRLPVNRWNRELRTWFAWSPER